jgi:hypothetical protein
MHFLVAFRSSNPSHRSFRLVVMKVVRAEEGKNEQTDMKAVLRAGHDAADSSADCLLATLTQTLLRLFSITQRKERELGLLLLLLTPALKIALHMNIVLIRGQVTRSYPLGCKRNISPSPSMQCTTLIRGENARQKNSTMAELSARGRQR